MILPKLLALITRHPREKVEHLEFRPNQWMSNLFRVWEYVFWRRQGIRIESSAYTDGRNTYYQCHTWEATFSYIEQKIRESLSVKLVKTRRGYKIKFFNDFSFELIKLPTLVASNGMPINTLPFGYVFAIALDTSGSNAVGGGNSSVTISSYTVTGSNTIMFVAANDQANSGGSWATNVTGITANGSATTKIGVNYVDTGPYGNNSSLWGKLAPSSGNVVASRTNTGDGFMIGAETLSGVDQGTAVGSLPTNGISNGTFSTPQASPAVTSPSNGWVAMSCYISIGAPAATAGTGTTLRQTVSGAEYGYLFDSGSTVSGSTTLQVSRTTTAKYAMTLAAVGPAGAATVNSGLLNFF